MDEYPEENSQIAPEALVVHGEVREFRVVSR